jgi:glycogen(starch) synthase
MTVLMTTDTVGGVWTYALDLARALGRRGVSVVLAAVGDPPSLAQRRDARTVASICLEHHPGKLEWMQDPWDDVRATGEWLLDLARACRADVVHLNGYAHATLPFEAPVLVVAHSCVVSWWEAVRRTPLPPEWAQYRRVVSAGLANADAIVAPSGHMARSLRRCYGVPASPRVIYNGSGIDGVASSHKQPLALSAGRLWDEAKNVATLARAAPAVRWPVYVAGDGGGELSGVRLLGRLGRRALARWYARAAIYVLPARYEPFGLSALEAALSGCALVLGDIPSLREIWGDAACYAPPDDAVRLAATVNALVDDQAALSSMATRALTRARRYTLDTCSDAYLALYHQLTGANTRKAGVPECA